MSSLLHAKRKLEALTGRVMFTREDSEVEVFSWDEYDLLGTGPTHIDAIADAHETIRTRAEHDTAECRGDAIRDARKNER